MIDKRMDETGASPAVLPAHPHFTVKGAEGRLREVLPGADIAVEIADMEIRISAVFPARTYTLALATVRRALLHGVAVKPWPEVYLSWAPDRRSWEVGLIREAVVKALPRIGGRELRDKVTVSTERFTMTVHVCIAGLLDPQSARKAEIKREWFGKVAAAIRQEKTPEGITNVRIQIGDPDSEMTLQTHAQTGWDDDDDDGYQANPNWPSRTGQRSGGGRGNNPPRR